MNPSYFMSSLIGYGPICCVPLGQSFNIFINDPVLGKKLLKDKRFNNRPSNNIRKINAFEIINGNAWKKRRQYCIQSIAKIADTEFILTQTKKSMQSYFKNVDMNSLFYPQEISQYTSFNNIFSAIYGKNVEYNDNFWRKYCELATIRFNSVTNFLLMQINLANVYVPQFLLDFLVLNRHKQYEQNVDDCLLKWMTTDDYKIDLNNNQLARGGSDYDKKDDDDLFFIDHIISAINNNKITAYEGISDTQALLYDSIDTSSKSSEYGILLLAKYADIQEKLYTELMDVLKKNNLKSFSFKILNELHLFRAFIYETLRISCIVYFPFPRQIYQEMEVTLDDEGTKYKLPKGSMVMYNTYHILKRRDWNNPENTFSEENNEIHLEYWLDENGKFKMNDNFILFSSGISCIVCCVFK